MVVGQNSTKGLASPISLTNIPIKVFGHSAKVIWLACFSSIRLSNFYFTRTWWMLLHFLLTLLDIYISIITGAPTTSYASTISTTPDYTTDLPYYSTDSKMINSTTGECATIQYWMLVYVKCGTTELHRFTACEF